MFIPLAKNKFIRRRLDVRHTLGCFSHLVLVHSKPLGQHALSKAKRDLQSGKLLGGRAQSLEVERIGNQEGDSEVGG